MKAAAAAARASFTDALGIFGLLALLLIALAFAAAARRRDEFAVDTAKMTTTGVSTLCSIASSQAYDACGPDMNVRRRMFFHDETKSTTPAMDADGTTAGTTGNNSDPYFIEKVVAGEDATELATMAKLKAGRLMRQLTDTCVQFWGGMGFAESRISRGFRDGRLASIGGGADEVMLQILSKYMGIFPKQV